MIRGSPAGLGPNATPTSSRLVGQPDAEGDGEPGFFGLAITVASLEAAAARLGDHLGTIKEAVQDGRQIATLRHRDLGMSVATALMSPEPTRA